MIFNTSISTFVIASLLFTIFQPARAASFDCTYAASPSELLICGDASLSALDEEVGEVFSRQMRSGTAQTQTELKAEHLNWIAERDAICGVSHDSFSNAQRREETVRCLRAATESRIVDIGGSQSLPGRYIADTSRPIIDEQVAGNASVPAKSTNITEAGPLLLCGVLFFFFLGIAVRNYAQRVYGEAMFFHHSMISSVAGSFCAFLSLFLTGLYLYVATIFFLLFFAYSLVLNASRSSFVVGLLLTFYQFAVSIIIAVILLIREFFIAADNTKANEDSRRREREAREREALSILKRQEAERLNNRQGRRFWS